MQNINVLVQDCGNSIAKALELPQSSAKLSTAEIMPRHTLGDITYLAVISYDLYSSRMHDAYVSLNWTIIGSDNGSSSVWCQAIISNNSGIFLIEPVQTNFSEI